VQHVAAGEDYPQYQSIGIETLQQQRLKMHAKDNNRGTKRTKMETINSAGKYSRNISENDISMPSIQIKKALYRRD